MGAVNSANIDNTTGKVNIFIAKKSRSCDCERDVYFVKDADSNVSVQYLNTNDPDVSDHLLYERSYIAEISSKHCTDKNMCACETEKLSMVVTYKLIDYIENNNQIKRFHGLGHVILRTNRQCTSVQVCLEKVDISSDGTAVATYEGYFEKDFFFTPTNGTKVDVCVTFMLTFTSLPPPV